MTFRFCLFIFRSSLCNLFFAWLHSSCGLAHQPVELSGKLATKPCVRPGAPLCSFSMTNAYVACEYLMLISTTALRSAINLSTISSVLTLTDLSTLPRRLNLKHGGEGGRPRVVVELSIVSLGMRGLRRRSGQHLEVSLPMLQGMYNKHCCAKFYEYSNNILE